MTNIKIKKLKITNFKGIRSLEIDTGCEPIKIFGDNATGKTTIFDAVTWLLFGKNSEDSKDFGIKTRVDGEELHKTEHIVECVLDCGDNDVTLKRIYKEKYSKPRGQINALYSGNTTEYFIDDVPKKQNEYQDFINSLAEEKLFKLLSNPLYFNEGLKWQERRAILTDICGTINDADVVADSADLSEILGLAKGKSIEDFKLSIRSSAKKTKNELEGIPNRIDENNRRIAPVELVELAKTELKNLQQQAASISQKIADANATNAAASIRQELAETKTKLAMLKERKDVEFESASANKKAPILELHNNIRALELEYQHKKMAVDQKEREVLDCLNTRERLIEEFSRLKQETIPCATTIDEACPTCGQELPADVMESAKQKAAEQEREFNLSKAARLEDVNRRGKENNAKKEKLGKQLDELDTEMLKIYECLGNEKIKLTEAETKLRKFTFETFAGIKFFDEAKTLETKIQELQTELDKPDETKAALLQTLREQKCVIDSEISIRLATIATANNNELLHSRIEELKKEEERLSEQYTELQRQLYLADEFTRTKTEYVTKKIESKFEHAKFNMFINNISNDGIEECCEATYKGVPYCDLNNAARINIGLDIIKTLSSYYKFSAPIFIDNAESVTTFIESGESQIIKLIVSEFDKKLRIERGL